MRALWTAASGMTTQQLNVDTISNNLANVNTAGYKKETANFKSLLYQNMEQANVPGGTQAPVPMQVGHGVRAGGITRSYAQGILTETDNPTSFAIEGRGFFAIDNNGENTYTRDGNFRLSLTDAGMYALVTTDGHPVLSVENEPILIEQEIGVDQLQFDMTGNVSYTEKETGTKIDIGQLQIVQFANVEGLEAIGANLYKQTAASGEALLEAETDGLTKSTIRSGRLEGSNVQVAEEMVNLIVAQRAYELNSTAIKTADTMMQQANELKRV